MLVAASGDLRETPAAIVVQGDALTGDGLGSIIVFPLRSRLRELAA